jgi:DNA-binding XRE family transcriptional regulator
MTFPEQLKTHRERLSLTQAELATFLEISPRAVWQWEKGELPHILTQEAALARLTKAKRAPKE